MTNPPEPTQAQPYPELRRGMYISAIVGFASILYSSSSYLNLRNFDPSLTPLGILNARLLLSGLPFLIAATFAWHSVRVQRAGSAPFRIWSILHWLAAHLTCWAYYFPLALSHADGVTIRIQSGTIAMVILSALGTLPRSTELKRYFLAMGVLFLGPQIYFSTISSSSADIYIIVGDLVVSTLATYFAALKIAEHNEAQDRIRDQLLKDANEHYLAGVRFAHDVRSPVGALKIVARQAATQPLTPEQNSLLTTAIERVEGLSHTMNESFRKLENTQRKRETHVEGLVRAIASEITQRFEIPPHCVAITRSRESDSVVDADPIEFGRVIANLLTNAWEAASPSAHPQISVEINCEGPRIVLSIRNSGDAIPPYILEQLGTKPITYKLGGTGVGFWSAKKYIESLRGTLSISSEPAQGTVVRAEIPRANLTLER